MSAPFFSVEDLTLRFGGLTAVDGLSFAVEAGSAHGLIGPNGAGKTSVFNVISGLVSPQQGHIILDGVEFDRLAPYARASNGLARTFQNIRLFGGMRVIENVMAGMHVRLAESAAGIILRGPGFRRAERDAQEEARQLLEFVGLPDAADRPAGVLSYGDQRRVEIARSLAARPKLLMLDEPAAGMNPSETQALAELLRRLTARGITLILVEHDMNFVMNLCDSLTVLNFGRKIAEGTPREVRHDPSVITAYLGAKGAARLSPTSSGGNDAG